MSSSATWGHLYEEVFFRRTDQQCSPRGRSWGFCQGTLPQHAIPDAIFYICRKKFGSMSIPQVKRLKSLEEANARLKKLLAGAILDKEVLQVALSRKYWRQARSGKPWSCGLTTGLNRLITQPESYETTADKGSVLVVPVGDSELWHGTACFVRGCMINSPNSEKF